MDDLVRSTALVINSNCKGSEMKDSTKKKMQLKCTKSVSETRIERRCLKNIVQLNNRFIQDENQRPICGSGTAETLTVLWAGF